MAQLAQQQQAAAPAAEAHAALASLCGRVMEGSKTLADFVSRNRKVARERGIDVAAMELQGIVDRERLAEVSRICTLKNLSMPVDPGLSTRLGRAEKILEDASREMGRPELSGISESGEASLDQDAGGGFYWLPFAVIGATVVGVVVLMSQTKKPAEPKTELPFFERKKR